MSTKWIRTMAEGELRRLEGRAGGDVEQRRACARLAIAEVEAIEKAAKDLDDNLAAQVFGSNGEKIEAALNLLQRIAEQAP